MARMRRWASRGWTIGGGPMSGGDLEQGGRVLTDIPFRFLGSLLPIGVAGQAECERGGKGQGKRDAARKRQGRHCRTPQPAPAAASRSGPLQHHAEKRGAGSARSGSCARVIIAETLRRWKGEASQADEGLPPSAARPARRGRRPRAGVVVLLSV